MVQGARLRIPANLEPSQVSQLEKFTTSSHSSEQGKWDFLQHSLSWISTELRPQKTERGDNKWREDGEREKRLWGWRKFAALSHPLCVFISVFYLTGTSRDTDVTHAKADLKLDLMR